MSKPAPGQDHRFDALTASYNQGAYRADIAAVAAGEMSIKTPFVCARVDVDNFRDVNTDHGHPAGDAALRHVASIVQQKVRERDRVYRAGGDEFAVLFTDFTEDEAAGSLKRALDAMLTNPVRWVSSTGEATEFIVTTSIGVAAAADPRAIEATFERADQAAYRSKDEGRARLTRASEL